ncbi:DUF3137 domain-containing protein [Notoacmeibacter ruber]|uniref:DUF3137 domain-containing protein n=1 Tax=Notoacmeibacter ruber TaxID=2670375 RepID=A0A3L7JH99_9HYPH|nr:DUF3137 domain-containing protein [Notoacmeibacter ruber]RLQ87862.1 DUF3137 domain-containing protein [Notoacmeibacter ruber]
MATDGESLSSSRFARFEANYAAKIKPELEKLEVERRKAARQFKLGIAAGLLGLLLIVIGLLANSGRPPITMQSPLPGLFALGGFTLFGGGFYRAFRIHGRFRGKMKSILVGKTCEFLGLDFVATDFVFPVERFRDAFIVPDHRERLLEDRIAGTLNGVPFELCEAHLKKKDGGEERNVFHGLLLLYRISRPFHGRTVLVPDLGRLGNHYHGAGHSMEAVALDDPRFGDRFQVYSTDPVETHALLTPHFMEAATELSGRFGNPWAFHAAFSDNCLLISIRVTKNMFEGGGLSKPAPARERVDELLAELKSIASIAEIVEPGN